MSEWFKGFSSLVRLTPAPEGPVTEGPGPVRPELNGQLLTNPAGTVWQVIDGSARGFVNESLFLRLHYWSRRIRSGNCGGGWPPSSGICVEAVQAVDMLLVPHVPSFIHELPPFDPSVRLISNPAGTVCLYENNGKRLVPNPETMGKYQFDWDKVMVLETSVFDAIPTGAPLT